MPGKKHNIPSSAAGAKRRTLTLFRTWKILLGHCV